MCPWAHEQIGQRRKNSRKLTYLQVLPVRGSFVFVVRTPMAMPLISLVAEKFAVVLIYAHAYSFGEVAQCPI